MRRLNQQKVGDGSSVSRVVNGPRSPRDVLIPGTCKPKRSRISRSGAAGAVRPIHGTSRIRADQTDLFARLSRDENRNQVLERNEHFIVEFEIKNEGSAAADDVEVHLTGHPAVIQNSRTRCLSGR